MESDPDPAEQELDHESVDPAADEAPPDGEEDVEGEEAGEPPAPAPSWTSRFLCVYTLDEAAGMVRANATDTACGSFANLYEQAGAPANDADRIEGEASLSVTSAASDRLGINNDCLVPTTGSLSMGIWVKDRTGSVVTSTYIDTASGASGMAVRADSNAVPRCAVGNGTENANAVGSFNIPRDGSAWVHLACTFDDGADAIQIYAAGQATGSPGYQDALAASSTLHVPTNSGTPDALLDELWMYDGVLSPAAVCRICSCGVDGAACLCSGGAYADRGRNATHCSSCDLPPCDQAEP